MEKINNIVENLSNGIYWVLIGIIVALIIATAGLSLYAFFIKKKNEHKHATTVRNAFATWITGGLLSLIAIVFFASGQSDISMTFVKLYFVIFFFFSLITAFKIIGAKTNNSDSNNLKIDVTTLKFVDLGLPSGTLWAEEDEKKQMSKRDINRKPDIIVPTKKQWDELNEYCKISVDETRKTATVTGPNGNSITFGLKQKNKRLISEAYISSTKCIVTKQELYYCSIIRYEKEAYVKEQLNTNHVAEPEQTLAIRTVLKG